MDLFSLAGRFKPEDELPASRPYFNHSVQLKKTFTPRERARMLEEVGLNVFFFPAEMVTGCDMLSDSGTTTMTNEQWAALHIGDVAYGSNSGYFVLMRAVKDTFGDEFFNSHHLGKPNAFLFHQGRPAEDALFTMLGRMGRGMVIPSNGHFDTTQANIEANGMKAVNLFSEELKEEQTHERFKGNIDLGRLGRLLREKKGRVPVAFLTVTNNTGGGNPVSMENIAAASHLAHDHGVPLFFDACRFAENAWFIKKYEAGYARKGIPEIVREMFSHVDGFTISFKKDGLANMGGGLFLKDGGLFVRKYPKLPDMLMNHQITKEGHPTYGGISGRDIMTVAEGLRTVVNEKYLSYRILQVQRFGEAMHRHGLPVLSPAGGHAVYLDVNRFFEGTGMRPEGFGGVSLTALLLAAYGHRACELGYFAFGSYDARRRRHLFPEVNFVRFAVPRLRYEDGDLDSVAESVKALYDEREHIPPVKVTYGLGLPLRHFKARFEFARAGA